MTPQATGFLRVLGWMLAGACLIDFAVTWAAYGDAPAWTLALPLMLGAGLGATSERIRERINRW